MPTITVSDTTFTELKSLAERFVDTPESLTARLIHDEVVRSGTLPHSNGQSPEAPSQLRSPRLAHPRQAADFHKQVLELPD